MPRTPVMTRVDYAIPDKSFFKIGETARLVGVEAYTIRYWETEFKALRPAKTKSRQRLFRPRDVQLLHVIRHLLHEQRFTIDGARIRLRDLAAAGLATEDLFAALRDGRPFDGDLADSAAAAADPPPADAAPADDGALATALAELEALRARHRELEAAVAKERARMEAYVNDRERLQAALRRADEGRAADRERMKRAWASLRGTLTGASTPLVFGDDTTRSR